MLRIRAVLAPVDFSEPSRTALTFAARFARQTSAALHVLFVEDPLLAEAARQAKLDLAGDAREELSRFVAAAAPLSEVSTQLHVLTGSPVDVILETARAIHADLTVVGSHGMSGGERLIFGSTTEGLLRRSTTSVAVTPPEWAPAASPALDLTGVGPFIAAVDFSAQSLDAAKAACRLAAATGTTVEIVHVVPELPVLVRWRPHADALVRERAVAARRELETFAQTLACVAPVRARVEIGPVPERLADAAAPSTSRNPILVLGRRTARDRDGAPGATAYRVLTHASVPVLLYIA